MNQFELLSTNGVPVEELLRAVGDLSSKDSSVQKAAEDQFAAAGPGSAPILMAKLNDARQIRRDRSMQAGLLFAFVLIGRSVLKLTGLAESVDDSVLDGLAVGLMAVGAGGFFILMRPTQAENRYYAVLEKFNQLQVLGGLAEYGYGAISDRSYFEDTIIRLIAPISQEEANALTNTQRLSLFRLLELVEFPNDNVSPALVTYIGKLLDAYRRMGDRRAIPYIKLFVDRGPESARGRELKKAATDVLMHLEALPSGEI